MGELNCDRLNIILITFTYIITSLLLLPHINSCWHGPPLVYTILYNLHCKNIHLSRWIRYVSSNFQNCGSNYVWLIQDYNIDAKIIFVSECDQFKQFWHSRIINKDNDHTVTYSLFKLSHGKEMYTEIISEQLKKSHISIQNRNIHITCK